ncbi:MAG: hypothetical protein ACXAEU_06415 [Candidatus Hodarchaeales archaeon]|jgi:hypothetical protein
MVKEDIQSFRMAWDGADFELLAPDLDEDDITMVEVDEEDGRIRIIYGRRAKVSFIEKRMIERKIRTMARAGFPHPETKRRVYPGLKIVIEEEVEVGQFDESAIDLKIDKKTAPSASPRTSPPVSRPASTPPEVSLKAVPPRDIVEVIEKEKPAIKAIDVVAAEPSSDMGSLSAYEIGEVLYSYLEKGKTVLISKGSKGYKFIVMDVTRDSFHFNIRKT